MPIIKQFDTQKSIESPALQKQEILEQVIVDAAEDAPVRIIESAESESTKWEYAELRLIKSMIAFFRKNELSQPEIGYSNPEGFFIDSDSILQKIQVELETLKKLGMARFYHIRNPVEQAQSKIEREIDKLRKMNSKQRREYWSKAHGNK